MIGLARLTHARWITLGVILTLCVISLGSWTAWRSYATTRELADREMKLAQLEGEVIHLDEVMTMSARMAASTGDSQWERRYRHHEPQLDAAIKQMLLMAPDEAVHAFSTQTDAANKTLVELENRAFALVHAHDLAQASAILSGTEYQYQKQVYADGMTSTITEVNENLQQMLATHGNRIVLQVALAAVLMFGLALAWGRAVVLLRNRSRRLSETLTSLESNHERLSDAHQQLAGLHRELIAKEKLSSLGMLSAGIAHEINNPMSYVMTNVNMLFDDLRDIDPAALPEVLVEYIDDVLPATIDGINRVNTIVRDLQRFARGDIGGMADYDLNLEIEAAVRISNPQIRSRCRLELALDDTVQLYGKAHQITQVLVNLIVNASHAIDDHQNGLITVTTGRDDDGAIIMVRDNGCGMSESVKDQAFQAFFTTKPIGQGTGLGLAVVHGIIQAHGGTISLVSEVGVGTVFTIQLPRIHAASSGQPPTATPPRASQVTSAPSSASAGRHRDLLAAIA